MKLINSRSILAILWLILCLVSCSKQNGLTTPIVTAEFPANVDDTIVLSAPDGWNTFRINSQICLWVELLTDMPVIIDDRNVEIYEHIDSEWNLIVNNVNDPPITYIISPNENIMYRGTAICTHPILGNRTAPVTLRFKVIGNLYKDGIIGAPVYAYIDVVLQP